MAEGQGSIALASDEDGDLGQPRSPRFQGHDDHEALGRHENCVALVITECVSVPPPQFVFSEARIVVFVVAIHCAVTADFIVLFVATSSCPSWLLSGNTATPLKRLHPHVLAISFDGDLPLAVSAQHRGANRL